MAQCVDTVLTCQCITPSSYRQTTPDDWAVVEKAVIDPQQRHASPATIRDAGHAYNRQASEARHRAPR
jgi:hypothetical protein